MRWLYQISIRLYAFMVWTMAPFHRRARRFVLARKGAMERLEADFQQTHHRPIWVHAASLGEYEQARPVIKKLRQANASAKILLTFFSPSGYDAFQDHHLVDHVHFLPMDEPRVARKFVSLVNPALAIFVKYELWYYYLTELHRREAPVLMISAIFRRNQMYFHPLGRFYLPAFRSITHFFLQDHYSGVLLRSIGIRSFSTTGDTRFDRVLEIADCDEPFPVIEAFKGEERMMVLGSVWSSDMKVMEPFIHEFAGVLKVVIAPHQVDEHTVSELEQLPGSVRYSEADAGSVAECRILIIDRVGLLSRIYRYGDFAMVGGAFRGALHNLLEAAVYGIPVFFGNHPANEKFIEAIELEAQGGAISFESYSELKEVFEELSGNESKYEQMCRASANFVRSRSGAANKVMKKINELI